MSNIKIKCKNCNGSGIIKPKRVKKELPKDHFSFYITGNPAIFNLEMVDKKHHKPFKTAIAAVANEFARVIEEEFEDQIPQNEMEAFTHLKTQLRLMV